MKWRQPPRTTLLTAVLAIGLLFAPAYPGTFAYEPHFTGGESGISHVARSDYLVANESTSAYQTLTTNASHRHYFDLSNHTVLKYEELSPKAQMLFDKARTGPLLTKNGEAIAGPGGFGWQTFSAEPICREFMLVCDGYKLPTGIDYVTKAEGTPSRAFERIRIEEYRHYPEGPFYMAVIKDDGERYLTLIGPRGSRTDSNWGQAIAGVLMVIYGFFLGFSWAFSGRRAHLIFMGVGGYVLATGLATPYISAFALALYPIVGMQLFGIPVLPTIVIGIIYWFIRE